MTRFNPKTKKQSLGALAVLVVLAFSLTLPTAADDRDLFRSAASEPYVFILFDTSGSMHWDTTNGFTVASGDDPQSKLYQAKSALYQVLRGLDRDVRLGWAHFPQERLEIRRKHWAYTRADGQDDPPWATIVPYPVAGAPEFFGQPADDDDGDSANGIFQLGTCADPLAEADTSINVLDLNFFSKFGNAGADSNVAYVTGTNNNVYKVTWTKVSGALGDLTIKVDVKVEQMASDCSAAMVGNSKEYEYVPAITQDNDNVVLRNAAGALPTDFVSRMRIGRIPGERNDTLFDINTGSNCDADPFWYPNNNTATGTIADADKSQLEYEVFTVPNPGSRYGPDAACVATDGALSRGSILPWDWVQHPSVVGGTTGFELGTRDELLCRLAPNTCVNAATESHRVTQADKDSGLYTEFEVGDLAPDFRIARYFGNTVGTDADGDDSLTLNPLYSRYPPIAANSGTPLAGMMRELKDWIGHWDPCAKDAVAGDRNFICRDRYVILLTDGAETCEEGLDSGTPPRNVALKAAAEALLGEGVKTFVVGFGDGVDANQLEDISDFGGTGVLDQPVGSDTAGDGERDCLLQFPNDPTCRGPILANDKGQLIAALNNLFSAINSDQASFASAAVPAGQTNAQDSIFLTDFVPLDGYSTWAGDMSHYVRPLPLRTVTQGGETRQIPDETKRCNANRKSSCLAWNANESMLGAIGGAVDQVPSPDLALDSSIAVDRSSLQLGTAPGQRRVYFGQGRQRLAGYESVGYAPVFYEAISSGDEVEAGIYLDSGLMDSLVTGSSFQDRLDAATAWLDDDSNLTSVQAKLEDVLRNTYAEKVVPSPLDSGPAELRYILGDVFHSDPQQLGEPGNLGYLQGNLPKGSTKDCDDLSSTSYQCFFFRSKNRRKVVFAGSNDGQLHAFDAGTFTSKVVDDRQVGQFDIGTGQELFSFIPNSMLRRVREISQRIDHEYGLDGEIRMDDVFIDPKHDGTPQASDRQWRSILIGSLREGGETAERLGSQSSYYALDVTQPDKLVKAPNEDIADGGQWVPSHSTYVPSCIAAYNTNDCGPLPYGAVLWEFMDLDEATRLPADDDAPGTPGEGHADLAPTWSRPTVGRVQVETTSGTFEDRYVAIFGGGYDPDNPNRGNWLYILDTETGLPLAKRQLEGAAPSAPAAVDTDGDAYLDTVYIGTVEGNMYKLDISAPGILDTDGRVEATSWTALKVFEAGAAYPMFTPPSVVFIPREDRFAISFGVGNRADLWDSAAQNTVGRFYNLLDTGWEDGPSWVPLTESNFETIAATDTTDRDNLLSNPPAGKEPGWILTLAAAEKLVSRPFTLSGITIFSTYLPLPLVASTVGTACERDGDTNIYTVFTGSANALISDRFRSVPGIVSNPFTELSSLRGLGGFGQTGDPDDPNPDPGTPGGGVGPNAEELDADLTRIRDSIAELFPESCRFNNVSVNIKVVRSDTGIEFVAPVPVCVQATNWKDF